jgi:hypothetical protein
MAAVDRFLRVGDLAVKAAPLLGQIVAYFEQLTRL